MKKLTPINIAQNQNISKQAVGQTISKAAPLSRDPKNFPVHRVPVNKKQLIYVPNHTVQLEDGTQALRMDTPYIHVVQDRNKRFGYYRCISGIIDEENGYDGTCPLCDGAGDPWTLANLIIKDKCDNLGLNPDDKENEDVKSIRSKAFSGRVLNDAVRYYTFPIVLFDTVNDDGKTMVQDENGNISFKTMWYSISETQWEKTWAKALENMEDEPTHPGGMFIILDYTYTPKRGEPNARDSARELKIYRKKYKSSDNLRAELDALTEDWTPEKAQEVVIRNNFYSFSDLVEVTDDILENTRNLIELYESKSDAENGNGIGMDDSFSLEKAAPQESKSASVVMDETDEDDDLDIN